MMHAAATGSPRVLIVDDHALIAQGVAVALEAQGVATEVTTGPTSNDVLEVARGMRPDVVLLDLQFDGPIESGVTLIAPLRELGATVVVLTGVTDRAALAVCLEAGAHGVFPKSEPFDHLVEKVLAAATGAPVTTDRERYEMLDELHTRRADDRQRLAPFERLTPREATVLAHLMTGHQAEGIAQTNFVSVATIRSQIRSILQKLQVNSQLAAVAMAREAGWELEMEAASA